MEKKQILSLALLAILLACINAFPLSWPFLDTIMLELATTLEPQVGQGVFGIGDLNNDGYDDILSGYDGRAAIYYGGDPMNNLPDIIWGRGTPNAFGDINGDNAGDFILHKSRIGNSSQDTVWAYWGGTQFDTIPDMIFTHDTTHGFGTFCEVGKDLNNDSYNDFIISDYTYGNPGQPSGSGRVYIYWGGDLLDNIADYTIPGDTSFAKLGWDMATGDLNNDGWDDLVIAGKYDEPFVSTDSLDYDYIDIYLGSEVPDFSERDYRVKTYWRPSTKSLGAYLCVFDFNADGFDDIISGNGYVFLGGAQFDTTAAFFLDNPVENAWDNVSINAGDLNNDGYDDLAFGLPRDRMGDGYALIYLGGPYMNSNGNDPDAGIVPDIGGISFGRHLAAAGDVNNDGINDIVVSGPGGSLDHSTLGVYSGDPTIVTGIHSPTAPPVATFSLAAAPNPFNGETTFSFYLAKAGTVDVSIFNLLGEKTTTVAAGRYPAGVHRLLWQPENSAGSGIYFARIRSGNQSETIKLLYIQ